MSHQQPVSQHDWVIEIMNTHDSLWLQISRNDVDDQKVVYADGPWTGLDIVAHLSTWNHETVASLQAHTRGEQHTIPCPRDEEDRFNREEVNRRRPWGAERIYNEWHDVHQQMAEAVRLLTPEQFQSPLMFPWHEIGSVAHMLREILKHEQEHVDDIVRAAQA